MRKIISAIYLFCLLSISNSLFAQVTFTAVNETVDCSSTSFCVDITISNFDSVTSFQHVYQWDTSVMTLTAFNDNTTVLAPGSLGIAPNPDSMAVGRAPYSWLTFNTNGETFMDGDVVAELCFDFNNAGPGDIIFSESNTTLRRVDGVINGTITGDIPAQYNNGTVTTQDLTAPAITCPSNVMVESFGTQINGIAPTSFSDNCTIDSVSFVMMMGGLTVNSGLDDASGSAFSLGSTDVTYTITDDGGNTDDCTFNVTLTTPPANAGSVQFIPEINLDCDANTVSIDILVINFDSITGMQFGVEWSDTELDFTGSSINLPALSSLNLSPAGNSILHLFAPLNPADIPYSLADSAVIFTLNFDLIGTLQSPAVNFIDFPGILIGVGQQQNGVDVNLVQDTDFFFLPEIINVIDNAAPTIANCPTTFALPNDMGVCNAVANWTAPTITDNCGLDTIIVSTMSGAVLPVGDSTITYTAVDLAGNMNTCSFVITVNDTEIPAITCPADITIDTDAGECTSSAAIGTATATDNCGILSLNSNAPTDFIVGTTNVTYTATDVNSLIATCMQIVTVQDVTIPMITCPANITECPNATITLGTPTASDACGIVSVMNDAPGTFPIGTTTVTHTAEDSFGNTNTCTQTVTLEDNENPMITCPANIDVCPGTTITIDAPTTSDNCGVASVTNDAPGTFPIGTTTVTHTVEDVAGNMNTCAQTVAIIDNENPMITCPANIDVCPGTTITIDAPTTSDNCGVASVTNDAPGTFPIGTTTVTHTVEDVAGNMNTCAQTVAIIDNENPMITCPANIDVCPGTTITIDVPVTSDNCGVASVNNDAPATFPTGTTTVTHTVEDVAGNINTCAQTVTIEDTENPMITCPVNIAECPGTVITIDAPVTSDNCGVASVTNDAPMTFPLGTTMVTHTVEDNSGNTNTCVQTVSIDDTANPMITCPANITECPGTTITIDAPVTSDNCGIASVTNDAPMTFPIGTTIVTHTVMNVSGNSNTCQQTITLEDTEDPMITCPANIDVCPGTTITIDAPVTSDNCGVASVTNDAPATFAIGTVMVTHTVEDVAGNMNTCVQTVSITDSEAPMITCPSTDAIEAEMGLCTAVYVNSLLPTVTDNCDTDIEVTFAITGDSSGSGMDDATGTTFNVGTSILTYTAEDDAGNMNTCMATIQVNDDQNPILTCPNDTIILAPGNIVDTMVNNIAAVVSDNCGLASLTFTYSGELTGTGLGNDASGTFFPPGVTTITYVAEDVNGNSVDCSFIVSVQETFVDLVDCPGDLVVDNDEDDCGAEVEGIAPILLVPMTDIASIAYTFSDATTGTGNDDASGESFNVGTTTVQYLVTDTGGNMDSCMFTITVNDTQNPTWSNCPDNISTNVTNTGDCSAIVSWSIPLPTDNCGVDNISSTATPGDVFPMGTTTVVYTATDAAGNMGTCSFDVTVIDNIAPIPQNCPDAIEVSSNLPDCQATVSWAEPTFDDCPPVSVTSTHAPGAVFNAGTPTTVIYIAVDPAGNDTTCTFTVTVIDDVAPVLTCPAPVTVNSLSSDCGAFVNWPAPTATDNCDNNVTISTIPSPGTFFPVGTTTVMVTGTDDAGNTDDCTFEVTVNDVFAPTFDCPTESIIVNVDGTIIDDDLGLINSTAANANCDMLVIDYGSPMAEDNCSVQSVVLNDGIPTGSAFPIGSSIVEFIAFDDSGNFTTCAFTIEVQDLAPIAMTISPNDTVCAGETIQLTTDVTAAGATFQWSGPGGIVIPSTSNPTLNDVTELNEGFYSVTVTYTSGCTVSATESLVVEEAAPVTASSNSPVCTGDDIELMTDVTTSGAMFNWAGPNDYVSTDPNPTIMDGEAGIYSVTVTYPGGCSSISSTNVSAANLPAPEIDIDCTVDLCLGDNCVLTGTEYAPSPDFYNWTASPASGAGLPVNTNDNQITITPTAPGIYVYTYSVELNGCQSEEVTIAITVEGAPDAVEDTYAVNFETATTLNVLSNDAFNSNIGVEINIIELPANGTLEFNAIDQNFTYTPNPNFFGTDQFFYEICNDCGPLLCDNALVTLNVEFDGDCEVPTLITPNGDNVNDQLVISCIGSGNFPDNEILIYNQWGDEVFTAAPYQNNWRGTHDGADLPDGTYYVIFKLGDNADPIKQFITIFR